MKILKKTVLFLFFIASYISDAQNFKEVDLQFLNNNKEQQSISEYLNIFLYANDCYRCISEIHQVLSEVEKTNPKLQVNFITDQVVFARKETKNYQLNKNYLVDKEVFKSTPKTFYYLKVNNEILEGKDKIISTLSNKKKSNAFITNLKISDSLFTSNNIYLSGIFYDNLIVYDNSLDLGSIVDTAKNKIQYYDITKSSKKLYDLPFIFESKQFELINYENFSTLKQDLGIPEIKVHAINVYDDLVYTNFTVSRLFKDLTKDGDVGLFSFNYVAVKKINENNKISEIFDLSRYDSYLGVDDLTFNSKTYRFGTAINYPFSKIIDKYHFVTKIYYETNFVGEAILELASDLKSISVVSIDTNASKNYIYPSLKIDDKFYYVAKEMTDESSGKGIIVIKESKIIN